MRLIIIAKSCRKNISTIINNMSCMFGIYCINIRSLWLLSIFLCFLSFLGYLLVICTALFRSLSFSSRLSLGSSPGSSSGSSSLRIVDGASTLINSPIVRGAIRL